MIAHPAPLSAGLKRAHASFHTPNPKRALVASSVVAPPAALSERIFSVRDPVHGDIELDYVCRVAIDTPEFQRLRGLKQLGACHTVFSGAIHTRFQHCIGTAHLARQLVQSLAANQPQLSIAAKDVICVTLAGLCHDLGHGPFSHTFELFVNDVGGGGSWTHEDASIMMLDQMLTAGTRLAETVAHAGLDATDIVFVKEMIVGKGSKPVGRPDPSQAFLYDIISNERSGLDVDKLDYLTRDSACSIGDKVDFSRILKQARVGWVADDSVGGASGRGGRATSTTICFPEKLIEDVLRVFRLRFELHGKLYQHRVTKAQELQIIDILKLADEHLLIAGTSGQRMRLSETVHDVQAYVKVKDSVLDLIECSCEPAMAPAQELLARMRDRRIYKSVGKVALESFGQLTEDDTFSRPEPWCSEEIDEKTGMVLPKTPAAIAEEMVDFYYRGKDADGHGCAADGGGYGSDELDVSPECVAGITPSRPGAAGSASAAAQQKQQLARRPRRRLRAEDLTLEYMKVHYGKKYQNPVNNVRFFAKDADLAVCATGGKSSTGQQQQEQQQQPPQAHEVAEAKYRSLLPRTFMDVSLRAFCKCPDMMVEATEVFCLWARRHGTASPFPAMSQEISQAAFAAQESPPAGIRFD